jgi:carbamoyl-phosphate synthase large subunit
MNVLVLSAAAKVLLVRAFRDAGATVLAQDVSPDNAALFEADRALLLPRSDDAGFPVALAEACAAHAVKLVVPTRDGELAAVAAAKPGLGAAGVTVLAPSTDAVETCQDKRRFAAFCTAHGFATPRTYPPGEAPERFPVFVRPVRGAGGKGACRVDGPRAFAPDLLVQDLEIDPEFTVDVLMDLAGRPLQAVARSRLAVRDGEAVKSRVEDIPALAEAALGLCAALQLVGHNVVQAFYSPERGPRFIEVNPRFGGASNLSIRAGLASPERLLRMVAGDAEAAARPRPIAHGLTLLRYADDRLVTPAELAAVAR